MDSGSFAAATNIFKCVVGSGIIGLPFSTYAVGYVVFPVCLALFAYIAYNSVDILIQVCEHYNVSSYDDACNEVLAKHISYPNFGRKLVAALTVLGIGIGITTFSFITNAQLPEIIKFLLLAAGVECQPEDSWFFSGPILVFLITWTTFIPAGFARSMEFLSFTSSFGIIVVVFIWSTVAWFSTQISCGGVIKEYAANELTSNRCNYLPNNNTLADWSNFQNQLSIMAHNENNSMAYCKASGIPEYGIKKFFEGVHNIVFAWDFHVLALILYAELKNRSREKMLGLCKKSFCGIYLCYLSIGIIGYFTWYEASIPDIFLSYSQGYNDNVIVFLARLGIVVSVLTTGMMGHYAARKSFCLFVWGEYTLNTEADTKGETKRTWRDLGIQFAFPIIFYNFCAFLAIHATSLQIFWNISAIMASLFMILFPTLFWLLTFSYDFKNRRRAQILNTAMFAFGIAMLIHDCYFMFV